LNALKWFEMGFKWFQAIQAIQDEILHWLFAFKCVVGEPVGLDTLKEPSEWRGIGHIGGLVVPEPPVSMPCYERTTRSCG
jgi:hypothetical protein